MSSLLKYTKRVLTVLLTAAMVFTSVPTGVYATENDVNDAAVTEVQETVAETGEETLVEEKTDAAMEEVVAEPSETDTDVVEDENTLLGDPEQEPAIEAVTLTFSAEHAIVTPGEGMAPITEGEATVDKDSTYKFSVVPNSGYLLLNVKNGETTIDPTDNVYSVVASANSTITVTTVAQGWPTASELASSIIPATVEDHPGEGEQKIDPVIDEGSYMVTASVSEENPTVINTTISGTNLKKHKNYNGASSQNKYWLGIGVPRPSDPEKVKFYLALNTTDELPETWYQQDTADMEVEGKGYCTAYLDRGTAAVSRGFVFAKYENIAAAKDVIYKFAVDMSGVTFVTGLPTVEEMKAIVKAPLHDNSESNPKDDDSLYTSYNIGLPSAEGNVLTVPVSARGLVEHKAGGEGGMGYWVGFGIPKRNGVTTQYKQSYTKIADPAAIDSWADALDDTYTVDGLNYDTVYFNANKADLVEKTGYVYVKYTSPRGDSVIFTYAVDMKDVELAGLPSASEIANSIVTAPLEDRETGAAKIPSEYLVDAYNIDSVTPNKEEKSYTIKIKAENLRAHKAGNDENGYWVGFGIPKNLSGATVNYKQSYTKIGTPSAIAEWEDALDDVWTTSDGKKYDTVYFNVKKATLVDDTGYVYVKYSKDGLSEIITFAVDMSGVTTDNALPALTTAADFRTATLHDTNELNPIPDDKLYSVYSLGEVISEDEDEITVPVTVNNLRYHKAGSDAGFGYWAGIAIPDFADENYTTQYYQPSSAEGYVFDGDPSEIPADSWKNALDDVYTNSEGKITHRTVYFNVPKASFGFGETYVKYTSKRDPSDSKIYMIVVEFYDASFDVINGEAATNIIAANLEDHARGTKETDLYDEGTYKVTTDAELGWLKSEFFDDDRFNMYYVPVKVEVSNLKLHTAGTDENPGPQGYWVGIGIPKALASAAKEVKYYACGFGGGCKPPVMFSEINADKDAVMDSEQTFEGKDYMTCYFNAENLAGKAKKGYLALSFADEDNAKTAVIYELDFSGVTLAKPEYSVELAAPLNTPVLYKAGSAEAATFTLSAVVSKKDTETPSPVAGVPVVWTTSDNSGIVTVTNASGNTDSDGKATATLTINKNTASKPGVFTVTATAAGNSYAALNYEIYTQADITQAVDLSIPSETEYVLTPSFELAADSQFMIRWSAEQPEVASVDQDGYVIAYTNGTTKFTQAIVNADGKVVNAYGLPYDPEYADTALQTGDGKYKATVVTGLESIGIEQIGTVYTTTGDDDILQLVTYPETFEALGMTVVWDSSNPAVAEISGDSFNPTIIAHKKGATTISASVTYGSKTYRTTKVVRVLPSVTGVKVYKQGDWENRSANYVYPGLYQKPFIKGGQLKLAVEVTADEPETDCSIVWESDDPSVATVDQSGVVTALKAGNVNIFATTPDGTGAVAMITVKQYIDSFDASVADVVIPAGGVAAVDIQPVPSDPDVADYIWTMEYDKSYYEADLFDNTITINAGTKTGSADIKITEYNTGKTATVHVTVGGESKLITNLDAVGDYTLYYGQSAQLAYVATPADFNNSKLVWTTTSTKIGVESTTGVVNVKADVAAESNETVTLEAYDLNNNSLASVNFTVKVVPAPKAKSIVVEPKNLTLKAPLGQIPGEQANVFAKVYPENAIDKEIEWSVVPANGVVDVNNGVVTALKSGEAVVVVTSHGNPAVKQSISVTVYDPIGLDDYATGRYNPNGAWIGDIPEYTYTGAAIKPEPNVYYGDVLLAPGVDYKLGYKNNTNAARTKNEPTVTATLKGNYAGSVTQTFVINPADLSNVTVNSVSAITKDKKGVYTEQLLKPTLTFNGKALKSGTDFDLFYMDDEDYAYAAPGRWGINIYGKGNFRGEAYAEEVLVDKASALNISKATVSGVEKAYTYTGDEIEPEVTVTYQRSKNERAVTLTEGEDYLITYDNNVNLGTATILITGIDSEVGAFYGTKKLTFKINPWVVDFSKASAADDLTVGINEFDPVAIVNGKAESEAAIPYAKGGPKPSYVTMNYGGKDFDLVEGVDFTCANKYDAKKNEASITVTGKGKFFKGKATVTYSVLHQDISQMTFVVDDYVYTNKADGYKKNKITIYDLDGKALKVNTDYEISDWETEDGTSIPAVGSYVTATITGKGMYGPEIGLQSSETISFRVISKDQKLSAASNAFMVDGEEVAASKFYVKYAGSPITMTEDDIVLKVKKKVGRTVNVITLDPSEYEVVAFLNNNKVGTATVVVRGTGEFGGLKNVTFKIKK